MHKHLLICLFGLLSWAGGIAQTPSVTRFLNPYIDSLVLQELVLLPDSGSLVLFANLTSGSFDSLGLVIGRLDAQGNPVQTVSIKSLLPEQMATQQSLINQAGELVILGRSVIFPSDVNFILYLDPETLALRNLQSLRTDSLSSGRMMKMIESDNGDLIVVGKWWDYGSSGNPPQYPFLARVDRDGNVVWQKTFQTDPLTSGSFLAVKEYAPSRYILLSSSVDLGTTLSVHHFLWKMDGSGNVLDIKEMNFDGFLESAEFIAQPNGGLTMAANMRHLTLFGHPQDDEINSLFLQIDTSLNPLLVRKFDDFSISHLSRDDDSTLVMVASTDTRTLFIRTDESGNIRSKRVFTDPAGATAEAVRFPQKTSNGNFAMVELLYDTANTTVYNDILITDGTGANLCRTLDTSLSPAISFNLSMASYSVPDTSYTMLFDSFPVFVNPYPHPIAVPLCESPCVWPGDANSDGQVDLTDLLNLGVAFGSSGQPRLAVSNDWLCQASLDWFPTFNGGLPYQYADCNGDGLVSVADTVAISQNYSLTHSKRNGPLSIQASGPGLSILIPQDSAFVGDTVSAHVLLGDSILQVDSIYGIAFRIFYDPALVDSGSFRLNFDSSWIGTPAQTLSMQQDNYSQGFCDGAIVRTDGNSVSGFGEVAGISFVLIDNIEGKREGSEILPLQIGGYTAIDFAQNLFEFSTLHDSLVVLSEITSAGSTVNGGYSAKVFPNPFEELINVRIEGARGLSYVLCDVTGRRVRQAEVRNSAFSIAIPELPKGIYFLSLETDKGILHRKLLKD